MLRMSCFHMCSYHLYRTEAFQLDLKSGRLNYTLYFIECSFRKRSIIFNHASLTLAPQRIKSLCLHNLSTVFPQVRDSVCSVAKKLWTQAAVGWNSILAVSWASYSTLDNLRFPHSLRGVGVWPHRLVGKHSISAWQMVTVLCLP